MQHLTMLLLYIKDDAFMMHSPANLDKICINITYILYIINSSDVVPNELHFQHCNNAKHKMFNHLICLLLTVKHVKVIKQLYLGLSQTGSFTNFVENVCGKVNNYKIQNL